MLRLLLRSRNIFFARSPSHRLDGLVHRRLLILGLLSEVEVECAVSLGGVFPGGDVGRPETCLGNMRHARLAVSRDGGAIIGSLIELSLSFELLNERSLH